MSPQCLVEPGALCFVFSRSCHSILVGWGDHILLSLPDEWMLALCPHQGRPGWGEHALCAWLVIHEASQSAQNLK